MKAKRTRAAPNVYIGESSLDVTRAESSWFGLTVDGVELKSVGMETPDWNLDGELGNDPRDSGVYINGDGTLTKGSSWQNGAQLPKLSAVTDLKYAQAVFFAETVCVILCSKK